MTPWDDAPPSEEELKSTASWADAPPSEEELKAFAPIKGDASNVGFTSYLTSQIPVLGTISDVAGAGGEALVKKALGQEGDIEDLYHQARENRAADLQAYERENPGMSFGGSIAGGALLPVAKGGLAAQSAFNATVAGTDALLKGQNPLTAALTGAGITAGMGAVGNAISAMPSLRDFAARRAVKASGAMTKDMRSLVDKGMLESTGRELLDSGVVKLGSSLEDIAERAAQMKEVAGEQIGAAIGGADEMIAGAKKMLESGEIFPDATPAQRSRIMGYIEETFGFNPSRVADRIRGELIEPNGNDPFLTEEVNKLVKIADNFESKTVPVPSIGKAPKEISVPRGPMTLQEGLGIKGSQRRLTNFDSSTVPQGFKQDLYKIVKEELENSVGNSAKLEQAMKNLTPGEFIEAAESGALKGDIMQDLTGTAGQAYKDANRRYAIMARAEEMAKDRMGAAQSNRMMSLTDYIAAGTGAVSGGATGRQKTRSDGASGLLPLLATRNSSLATPHSQLLTHHPSCRT